MAGRIRTIDFLPEVFRTETNKQFLHTTLDQLVQEPRMRPLSGYIGRKVGATVQADDRYVVEPSKTREQYQLEPAVTFLDPASKKVDNVITFPGLLDTIRTNDGNVSKIDRLFDSEFYSWDPFIDFDKFINFSQYYWLPYGPDSVDVASTAVPVNDDFDIVRSSTGYEFSGLRGTLPVLTLVRGGSYQFNLTQAGANFWIQAAPGVNGIMPGTSFSSRDVFGVLNNGEDAGTVIFNVPDRDAQNEYFNKPSAGVVDLVSNLHFDQLNNRYLSDILINYNGIDGVTNLEGKTVIFTTRFNGEDGGWVYTTRFDGTLQTAGSFDNVEGFDATYNTFDKSTLLTDNTLKYGVWRIQYVYEPGSTDPYIQLVPDRTIDVDNRLEVNTGNTYAGTTFWKTEDEYFSQVPLLTANLDFLYYQDSVDPDMFGVIRIIDESDNTPIYLEDILGHKNYTSPNNVTFTNGLKIVFRGLTYPEEYSGQEFYVEGVGESISLHPVENFVSPEGYTRSVSEEFDLRGFDIGGYDESLNSPLDPDYITINRASQDQNAWTRSNRWFHSDVIALTAEYNNTTAEYDNDYRAKRPIIEFRPNIKLYNSGVNSIGRVNIMDTVETDAFSNIHGSFAYSSDNFEFINGTRVIFLNDADPEVRNKVYEVSFEEVPGYAEPLLLLNEDSTVNVVEGSVVLVTNGLELQGTTYYYNNGSWVQAQQKESINQPPKFDVFDSEGISYSDNIVYPSTTFRGCELFSYAVGSGVADPILNKPLQYKTINNVGDIVFENDLSKDVISYVQNAENIQERLDNGFVRQYSGYTDFTSLTGWQKSYTQKTSRQVFSQEYTGEPIVLDVLISATTTEVPVKVFVNGRYILRSTYDLSVNAKGNSVITFVTEPEVGSTIEVSVLSEQVSSLGYFSVPGNLETNAVNKSVDTLTLGAIRNHYSSICQNIPGFSGAITGVNNTRDLGKVVTYGTKVVQQSAPVTFASMFMKNETYDFFDAIRWTANRYEEFKNKLLTGVVNGSIADFSELTPADILDRVLEVLNEGKTEISPFYWSDMLPYGSQYEETEYEVYSTVYTNFNTLYTYDFENASNKAILVYLNDRLLVKDQDYVVATDGPRIQLLVDIAIGDIVVIREYVDTFGCFVPPTPSKLGMYGVYKPEIYIDNTYSEPTKVILGHDGSTTVAFNDIRDEVLLEYETRVYNNIKVHGQFKDSLHRDDVQPGQFYATDYEFSEINEILSESFLQWVGDNRLDYKTQDYNPSNPFTWNFSACTNKVNGDLLLGNWRGIYNYFYNTDAPHMRPWEMVGLTERPAWWVQRYGPAPYTSGNLVLWQDMADGRIADPMNTYIDERYVRPELLSVIPVDSEGKLLSPMETVVAGYSHNDFKRAWQPGDGAPVETAWRRSSHYPFAVQRMLALTKPAKYFALFSDLDRYRYNNDIEQYVVDGRARLQNSDVEVYGNGVAKHSYINWVVDYNRVIGLESSETIKEVMSNIDIRLAYRLGGFSDKRYLKVFAEKSSPESQNSSLLIPDESYSLMLYKNPTSSELRYSAVIIQRTENGYSVSGYSTRNPYFEILPSIPNGNYTKFTVGRIDARIPHDFRPNPVRVPYGYEFKSASTVVDFLVSYGKLLEQRGVKFNTDEGTVELNWSQMAVEFLVWQQENWSVGSLINLNPSAERIDIERANLVVDSLIQPQVENAILNQNNQPISPREYVVERSDNLFTLKALTQNTFNFLRAKFTSYEHIMVFDNSSIFSDLIYDPITGARQSRFLLKGYKSIDWNGTVNAPGFILNEDNIKEWNPNKTYNKGDIVTFKGAYWSAATKVQPNPEFKQEEWIASDYNKIQKGLLPNIATKAEQIRGYYDLHSANLESDADLLGFGLAGFRQRNYMSNLNLDDITQVNLYKEFIGTKGTRMASDMFSNANLTKEIANYDIYENWAILKGSYGATANRAQIDILLQDEDHFSNPSTVAIVAPGETNDEVSQTVPYTQLYRQSFKLNNKNVFPETVEISIDETLPTAGYLNIDDVDFTVFDIADITDKVKNNVDQIVEGTTFWVAKDSKHSWNIYRTTSLEPNVITVRDNLNETCTITFDAPHGLTAGELVIIKDFDEQVNSAYIVETAGTTTITVCLGLDEGVVVINGEAPAYKLLPAHVAQASDINNLNFVNNIAAGDKIWVDTYTGSDWAVLEKVNPYVEFGSITPDATAINTRFGDTVVQGFSNTGLLVPNTLNETVYAYSKQPNSAYFERDILEGWAADTAGFGSSIAASSTTVAVIGAPDSSYSIPSLSGSAYEYGFAYVLNRNATDGSYSLPQLLTPEVTVAGNARFGESVAVSDNGKNMFVTAPGANTAYMYTYHEIELAEIRFIQDTFESNLDIDISGSLKVNEKEELLVVVNGTPTTLFALIYGNTTVRLFEPVDTGDEIRVLRRTQLAQYYTGATSVFVDDIFFASDINSFTVVLNNSQLRPQVDYEFNSVTREITFASPVTGFLSVEAKTGYWKLETEFAMPANATGVIASSDDGRKVLFSTSTGMGQVVILDRVVEQYSVPVTVSNTFELSEANSVLSVKVNNRELTFTDTEVGNEYEVAGTFVTIFETLYPGDIVEIETVAYKELAVLDGDNGARVRSNYGASIAQSNEVNKVFVADPQDSTNATDAGSVDVWVNAPYAYGKVSTTNTTPTLVPGNSIRINDYYVTLSGSTLADLTNDIVAANIPNIAVSLANDKITISVTNKDLVTTTELLSVAPGVGTLFDELGFAVYVREQIIDPNTSVENGYFGTSIDTTNTGNVLIVGEPGVNDGSVYVYDYLPSASNSAANPGKFVYGQQIVLDNSTDGEAGSAVSYHNGTLIIGTPGVETETGAFVEYYNQGSKQSWTIINQPLPKIDVRLVNSMNIYNTTTNKVIDYIDYIDPIQGKILGQAKQNLDYLAATDPAAYNADTAHNNYGSKWTSDHLGEIWWDLTTVRFIDYYQDDVAYRSKRWGQVFPGSSVDVYQWTESKVPPAEYVGPGTPYSTTDYTINSTLNVDGTFATRYYFWVKGLTSVSANKGKTLSVAAIAQYIENPKSSGIPYAAIIAPNVVSLYNLREQISVNTVLHIDYDRARNDDNIHLEYEMVSVGNPTETLSPALFRKLLDSFCGEDSIGNLVPAADLSPANMYGVKIRPRQTMFADRLKALEIYCSRANTLMARYPIVENRTLDLLESEDPIPGSTLGLWDVKVSSYAELTFIELSLEPVGRRYLVETDESQNGQWTIYTLQSDYGLLLTRVQNYRTDRYWDYADWIKEGYDISQQITHEVNTRSDLSLLTPNEDETVAVRYNSRGKRELYNYQNGEWVRVFAQDATIKINSLLWDYETGGYGFDVDIFDAQRFEEKPTLETRRILQSLSQEIFVDDLAEYRNELLILMFEYIMTEQTSPDWLFKTSLIDVEHKIRELDTYAVYRQDNQDFVLDYLNEVKPYHVKIKNFSLKYSGTDLFDGAITDFDVPSYFNTDMHAFISPQYTDEAAMNYVGTDDVLWGTRPWSDWYNNHKLQIVRVDISNGGSGYTLPPQVDLIGGNATEPAVLTARVNAFGEVIAIDIESAGYGYTETPELVISGGNGNGATAVAVVGNQQVRSIKTTMKFDRYEYTTSVVDWVSNVVYNEGDLVRFGNEVYRAAVTGANATFEPENFELVDQSTLSAADRAIGLYSPDATDPGRDLALLIAGIEYPGVQVKTPAFNEIEGYASSAFDSTPFDYVIIGDDVPPEYADEDFYDTVGFDTVAFDLGYNLLDYATYDPAILDSILRSDFTDTYLGTNPAPAYDGAPPNSLNASVITHGGEFVDTFSSHAPEELVPGASFDTLDMRVYSNDPAECNFGIFQDMLGNQKLYRILDSKTTMLTEDLSPESDIIYVDDASRLPEPMLALNIWGVIHINGERILYRYKNGNELSGLLRGVAGTAAADHLTGDLVRDMSIKETLYDVYQPAKNSEVFMGDSVTNTFVSTVTYNKNINFGYLGKVVVTLTVGGSESVLTDYEIINANPLVIKVNSPVIVGNNELVTIKYASPTAVDYAETNSLPVVYQEFSQLGIYINNNTIYTYFDAESAVTNLTSDVDYHVLSLNPLTIRTETAYESNDVFLASSEIDKVAVRQIDGVIDTINDKAVFETALGLASEVRVLVGGRLLTDDEYDIVNTQPIEVELVDTPAEGVEVEVFVVQSRTLYNDPSNGLRLSEQTTDAARFIRGEINR